MACNLQGCATAPHRSEAKMWIPGFLGPVCNPNWRNRTPPNNHARTVITCPPPPHCSASNENGVLLRLFHLRRSPSTRESRFARLRLSDSSSHHIMDILCVYCFDVLGSELEKRTPIPFPAAHLAKTNPKLLTNGDAESHDVVSIDTN